MLTIAEVRKFFDTDQQALEFAKAFNEGMRMAAQLAEAGRSDVCLGPLFNPSKGAGLGLSAGETLLAQCWLAAPRESVEIAFEALLGQSLNDFPTSAVVETCPN